MSQNDKNVHAGQWQPALRAVGFRPAVCYAEEEPFQLPEDEKQKKHIVKR